MSNRAALVPGWMGSLKYSEAVCHLLPFFSGLPGLVSTAHCADGLRMKRDDLGAREHTHGFRGWHTLYTLHYPEIHCVAKSRVGGLSLGLVYLFILNTVMPCCFVRCQ